MGVVDLGKIRGTMWYAGTSITGTSSAPVIFENSGISFAYSEDLYMNSDNGNIYQCVTPGEATVATWTYIGCIEGPQPPLANTLSSNSTTTALTAKMGKSLNDKINSAGLYPLSVIPKITVPTFLVRMTIEDVDSTVTLYAEDGEVGTFPVTALGISDRQTISIPVNVAIGFSTYGKVLTKIEIDNAAIFEYTLYDENTREITREELKLWDSLLDQIANIARKGTIAEDDKAYHTGSISLELDGSREEIFPITHTKAVWHNKKSGETAYEVIEQIKADILTNDAAHTLRESEIEGVANAATETAAAALEEVDILAKELIPCTATIEGNVITTAYEAYTKTTRITTNTQGDTVVTTSYANNEGYEEFSAVVVETVHDADGVTVVTKEVRL